MTTQHSLPGTPSRRILGDLTPQAMNTPSKTKSLESSELTRAQSPLKQLQATSHTPRIFADKENVTGIEAFPHGRKRSIAEVDDAEKVPAAKMVAFERDTPQHDAIAQLTSAAVQRHTVHVPAQTCLFSADPPVQQPSRPRRPRLANRTRNPHTLTSVSRTTITALSRLAKVLLGVPRLRPLRVSAKRTRRRRPRTKTRNQTHAQNTHKRPCTQIARPAPPHASDLRQIQGPHKPSLEALARSPLRLRAVLVTRRAAHLGLPDHKRLHDVCRGPRPSSTSRATRAQHHDLVALAQPGLCEGEPRPLPPDRRAGPPARELRAAAAQRRRGDESRGGLRGGQLAARAERESRGADESYARWGK